MRKTLLLAAAAVVLAACDSTEPRVPAAIEVNPQSVNLQVGETITVEARVVDDRGRSFDEPPEGFNLVWRSLTPAVATVEDGAITGVYSGQGTIQVEAGNLPAAQVQANVDGTLQITNGTFDVPILTAADTVSRAVEAQFAFAYAGHRTGTVSVDEEFDVLDGSGDYAAMEYNGEFRDQDFFAWQRRANGLVDLILFAVDAQADTITAPGSVPAYYAEFWLGWNLETDVMDAAYFLDSSGPPGTVEITSVTQDRIAGTFTMTLEAEHIEGVTGAALLAPGEVPTSLRGAQRDLHRDLRRDLRRELLSP
jgi:hypothetical protein